MSLVYFVTHPDVVIDKNIPIPDWDLSEKGISRTEKLLKKDWIKSINVIYSSNEQKAKTTAKIIAEHLKLKVKHIENLGEIDRSSTGLLGEKEFWKTRDQFFANSNKSIRGWEKAIDAQKRVVKAVKKVIKNSPEQSNILIAAHGAIGALLLCCLKQKQIHVSQDQPGSGGGNYFVFDKNMKLVQAWKAID